MIVLYSYFFFARAWDAHKGTATDRQTEGQSDRPLAAFIFAQAWDAPKGMATWSSDRKTIWSSYFPLLVASLQELKTVS